jgi:hypothetical protein
MPSVSTGLTLRLVLGGSADVLVPATLAYDSASPFAVSAVFHTSEGDVTWVFGRDLLEDGLRDPVGQGDVAVWPSHATGHRVVCVSLASPSGSALLEADESDLVAFLDASFAVTPMGTEMDGLDLDAELAALLGDGSTTHY